MSIFPKAALAGVLFCGPAYGDNPTTTPAEQTETTTTSDGNQVIVVGPHTTTSTSTTEKDGVTTTVTVRTEVGETKIVLRGKGNTVVIGGDSLKITGDSAKTEVAATKSVDPNAPVVIPFELLSSGHIAIMAKVNGKGPYRFIFDTGAPTLVMSEKVARDSGVLPKDFRKPFFAPLGNLGEFSIKSLELGDGKQVDISTNVWDHPTVVLLAKTDGPLEGLIGFPFFAHYDLAIDYKTKTLTLTPSQYRPIDTKELMAESLTGQSTTRRPLVTEPLGLRFEKPAGDTAAGVKVTGVYTHSPAEAAGIKPGDRLLTLDGRWTDDPKDCAAAAAALTKPGEYPLTVSRDGRVVSLRITTAAGI